MKKKSIAISCKRLKFKGNFKKLTIGLQQFAIALVFIVFVLPINTEVLASDKKIKPGKKQATLFLSDGRKIILGAKSDTIVHSKTKGVHIKIDSTGINYITNDNAKKTVPLKKKVIEQK